MALVVEDNLSSEAIGDVPPSDVSVATDAVEWDRYVSSHRSGTVDHLWAWRRVFERALGHQAQYLIARRDRVTVGVLPLVLVRSRLFGRSIVSVPFLNYGGVLADDPAVVVELVDAAREAAAAFDASHIELRHMARQCPTLPSRQHKVAMTLPLPPSSEALWTSLDRKVRNQVRKAQKEHLQIVEGRDELVDEFYTVFSRNMRDLGTPVYPIALFRETLEAFPEYARVFVVRHLGKAVAGGIGIRFRDTVMNPWASSLREFRHLSPNMLLYWAMIERAISEGASLFDFGRSSPGGGTHHFKRQWGAAERSVCWEYVLLSKTEPPDQGPSNPMFERAIALWQRMPLWLANALGPAIARNLP